MITAFYTSPGNTELVNLICQFISDEPARIFNVNSEQVDITSTDIAIFFGEQVERRVHIKYEDGLVLPTLQSICTDAKYETYLKLLQFRPQAKFRAGTEIVGKSGTYTVAVSKDGSLTSTPADVILTEREVQVITDICRILGCQEVNVVTPSSRTG